MDVYVHINIHAKPIFFMYSAHLGAAKDQFAIQYY